MAIKRLTIDGYGQLELNQVAFRRDGRIEAQCALDKTNFADKVAENGMLLAVDAAAKSIKLPTDTNLPIALNYSAEHMYDQTTPGLKNFSLHIGTFYPRLGYLSVGDKFTTNTICYDTTDYADENTLTTALEKLDTTAVYGTSEATTGAIKVTKTKPASGIVLKAIKWYTMPDGQPGVKFQVLSV